MTPAAFKRLALSMPEAHEEPHFERTSFRIAKKIFATMTADGTEAMVPVKDPDLVQTLLASHPEVFFSHGGWTVRNGSLGVRLAKADAAMMKDLVSEAWRRIAPKRITAPRKAAPRRAR
jgi:hypothetical protein